MERSRLRRRMGMRYALLNPILEELVKEGRIRITTGKDGDFDLIGRAGKLWHVLEVDAAFAKAKELGYAG